MTDLIGGRDAALKRQKAERAFEAHVAAYLAVNAMLAGVRALSGARPVWPVRTMVWWGMDWRITAGACAVRPSPKMRFVTEAPNSAARRGERRDEAALPVAATSGFVWPGFMEVLPWRRTG